MGHDLFDDHHSRGGTATAHSTQHGDTAPIPVYVGLPPRRRRFPDDLLRLFRGGPRWLLRGFLVAVLVVLCLAVADLTLLVSHQVTRPPAPIAGGPTASGAGGSAAPSRSTTTRHHHRPPGLVGHRPKHALPSSTTTQPALAPGAPRLSRVTPSQGYSGETVVVYGLQLSSTDGIVLAKINGQPTRTSCPNRSSCYVVVPAISRRPGMVPLTITTAAGTSNFLDFRYR